MTRRWPRRGLRDQRPRSQRRTLLLLEVHFDCSGCDEQRLGHFLGGTAIDLLGGTAIDGQARHAQLAQVRASRPLVRIRRGRAPVAASTVLALPASRVAPPCKARSNPSRNEPMCYAIAHEGRHA